MEKTVKGLILKSRNLCEYDRIATILTEQGIIEAVIRGKNRITNNPLASVSVFGYYEFSVFFGKKTNYINSAAAINGFYDLRLDVVKVSLASYFSELTIELSPQGKQSADILRLFLNTLYLLETDKREMPLLKAVFELRLISSAGFMPNLVSCAECHCYENETFLLIPEKGGIYCTGCAKSGDCLAIEINIHILTAMRHIVYSEPDKLFNFKCSGAETLSRITEKYAIYHIQKDFNSLEMYRRLGV
ncbi:MAG: DNA repair protein RecO [Oscillospiraceae bacterium]|nr:DNA repair protein RecO [Oscillospiraceae bacterium]